MAVVGVANALPGSRQPHKPLPALIDDPDTPLGLPRFPSALASLPKLEQAATGEGLINATLDGQYSTTERGVLRRPPR